MRSLHTDRRSEKLTRAKKYTKGGAYPPVPLQPGRGGVYTPWWGPPLWHLCIKSLAQRRRRDWGPGYS